MSLKLEIQVSEVSGLRWDGTRVHMYIVHISLTHSLTNTHTHTGKKHCIVLPAKLLVGFCACNKYCIHTLLSQRHCMILSHTPQLLTHIDLHPEFQGTTHTPHTHHSHMCHEFQILQCVSVRISSWWQTTMSLVNDWPHQNLNWDQVTKAIVKGLTEPEVAILPTLHWYCEDLSLGPQWSGAPRRKTLWGGGRQTFFPSGCFEYLLTGALKHREDTWCVVQGNCLCTGK